MVILLLHIVSTARWNHMHQDWKNIRKLLTYGLPLWVESIYSLFLRRNWKMDGNPIIRDNNRLSKFRTKNFVSHIQSERQLYEGGFWTMTYRVKRRVIMECCRKFKPQHERWLMKEDIFVYIDDTISKVLSNFFFRRLSKKPRDLCFIGHSAAHCFLAICVQHMKANDNIACMLPRTINSMEFEIVTFFLERPRCITCATIYYLLSGSAVIFNMKSC